MTANFRQIFVLFTEAFSKLLLVMLMSDYVMHRRPTFCSRRTIKLLLRWWWWWWWWLLLLFGFAEVCALLSVGNIVSRTYKHIASQALHQLATLATKVCLHLASFIVAKFLWVWSTVQCQTTHC